MPDFVCCTGSFKADYLTYCRAPPSAATSNLLLWLPPVPRQLNSYCSQAGGYSAGPAYHPAARRPTAVAGSMSCCAAHHCLDQSGHCSELAADGWRCLLPARHRHCTVCKRRAAGLERSWVMTPFTVCYIAVLYHTFQWFITLYTACYIAVTKGHIAC